ncbi:hypothetical protein F5Y18DRAFT_435147 [Xylariaceae sp. FL1019]|nr:hypothetical protein F5Y18DRAFT_435147 [Xylariaceae sp. FL1019]
MNKAKESLKEFVSKAGHHDTTVHKTEAPAVQHETVKPRQHENINTAIDKEVHQDHYHHTVQPLADREVLPEQHHFNQGEVQHREFDHRDEDSIKRRLAAESQKFQNERVVEDVRHTRERGAVQQGEHVHHHVHETVQPIVHKETVEPHVVHTTVPIHEVHHNEAQHHSTTTLPTMSMEDYRKSGSVLGKDKQGYSKFEGTPEERGGILNIAHGERGAPIHHQSEMPRGAAHGDFDPRDQGKEHRHESRSGNGVSNAAAGAAATAMAGREARRDEMTPASGLREGHREGHHHDHHRESGREGYPTSGTTGTTGTTGKPSMLDVGDTTTAHRQTSKPSLMDKLNPMKDSDGDGKKGLFK